MTTPQPGRACPVDLRYLEPQPPNLDLPAIIGHGRRIRRRRRLVQAGVVLAACVAAGSVVAGAVAAPNTAPIDALVADDPPANGELTLISTWPRHWTTVAWTTRRGVVCWATFRTPMHGATEDVDCPWDRSAVPRSSGIELSPLIPDVALPPSAVRGSGTAWPILGLTSAQAVRVVLSAAGKDVSATVVSVPISAGETVGVFLAWIRIPDNGLSTSDVTSETAYDRSGHIIAQVSNPP
jgi:hypothetical protein